MSDKTFLYSTFTGGLLIAGVAASMNVDETKQLYSWAFAPAAVEDAQDVLASPFRDLSSFASVAPAQMKAPDQQFQSAKVVASDASVVSAVRFAPAKFSVVADIPQSIEIDTAPRTIKNPDKLKDLKAIELMHAAAQGMRRAQPSQLDIILAALPAKFETPPSLTQNKTVSLLPTALFEPPEPTNYVSLASANASTDDAVLRPIARPLPEKAIPKKRARSAKFFHRMQFHRRQKPASVPCVAELQLIANRTHIYFDTSSSRVDLRGKSAVRMFAAKAQSCPEAKIGIIGFTDPGGDEDVNLKISWQRANSVFRSIEEAGFSMSTFHVSSHMEDHPHECVHYEGVDRRVVFDVRQRKNKNVASNPSQSSKPVQ